jgi:prevent-host-death family protein
MTMTTVSSREFNQDVTKAKKAAAAGPVFIANRGKPAHVLLTVEDYRRLAGHKRNIADALAMPGVADIAFDPPRMTIGMKAADFNLETAVDRLLSSPKQHEH